MSTGPALPPQVRIVVVGNSTAVYVRPRRAHRGDRTYGEVLEDGLRSRGVDATVVNQARWWERVHEALPRWEDAVHAHMPEVVIVNYGIIECQPNILPGWLLRWVYSWRPSLHPVTHRLRAVVVRPLQTLIARGMPPLSRMLGMHTWRLRPRRFRVELQRLIQITRREAGALVLVLTINPPGPSLQARLPGIDRRAAHLSEVIRSVVHDVADPQVQVIEAGATVDDLGWEHTMVDGLHYNARGHVEVAALLEAAVLEWLDHPGPVR